MEITFYHKNLTKKEEKVFVDYVNEKKEPIESLLTKFAKDAAILKASIEKFDKHGAYQVEFCLVLPMKTIIAQEDSHQITKAVDLSKDRVVSQLKKLMAILRRERGHKSIRNDHHPVRVADHIEV